MAITQVVTFTREELERIADGQIYAFVNPGDDREIIIMTDERCEKWREENE